MKGKTLGREKYIRRRGERKNGRGDFRGGTAQGIASTTVTEDYAGMLFGLGAGNQDDAMGDADGGGEASSRAPSGLV
jgi:hypothetical protein